MITEFKTVLSCSSAQIERKNSKFISSVSPVDNLQQATDFIDSVKSKYWDAKHNAYAYTLINVNGIDSQKYSDNGEPAGTAGVPILEIIKKLNLWNLVVVVTRYFGGTLLGGSGLIKAYSKCTLNGIEAAQIVSKLLCYDVHIHCNYDVLGKIRNIIEINNYTLKNIIYRDGVSIHVWIPTMQFDKFKNSVCQVSCALAHLEIFGESYELCNLPIC